MAELVITEALREELESFFKKHRKPELLHTYLFFLEKQLGWHPVLFVKDRLVFQSKEEAVKALEKEGKLWRETEIKIGYGLPTVNDQTKRVYICPHTGKVFGDNTHPNPQDAIYDWVSTCPENTERAGGVKVKRFFVSEDPDVIKNYIEPPKKVISKVVYSSALSGKLFGSKAAVIEDFKVNYLKPVTLVEVQSQNKFQFEEKLLNFLQQQLREDKISSFVEALHAIDGFSSYMTSWFEEGDDSEEEA